jgi:FtsH-binding integral membrane protein
MSTQLLRALFAAIAGFLRVVWRAARQLFHEMTGALFALFAALGGVTAWREWQKGSARWILAVAVLFTLAMAFFALTSFLRARRVQ